MLVFGWRDGGNCNLYARQMRLVIAKFRTARNNSSKFSCKRARRRYSTNSQPRHKTAAQVRTPQMRLIGFKPGSWVKCFCSITIIYYFQANRRDILEIFEVSKQFLYFVAELRRYWIHCQKVRIIIWYHIYTQRKLSKNIVLELRPLFLICKYILVSI